MSRKIVVFYDSPRGTQSNTKEVIDYMLNKLSYDNNLEASYIDTLQYKIRSCRECSQWFSTGKCPLDKDDEMKKGKRSLLAADLVILGTLVFAGEIDDLSTDLSKRIVEWFSSQAVEDHTIINDLNIIFYSMQQNIKLYKRDSNFE